VASVSADGASDTKGCHAAIPRRGAQAVNHPGSTKNKDRKRDPEMHSSQKSNEWHFGMKAHIGVDADSGLVHAVIGTSGNVADVVEGNSLLHRQETDGFGDAFWMQVFVSRSHLRALPSVRMLHFRLETAIPIPCLPRLLA
jgi:hypothetical protein